MNILYGICGIGLGHMYRQLPLLEELRKEHKIAIFAYGESLKVCRERYGKAQNIRVIEVAVPYLVGNKTGLDFAASAKHPANQQDFSAINMAAMAEAQRFIGKPDKVITDYEPNAAQYAYAYDAPLYTIDQQSKYLVGDFAPELGGCYNHDEVARLRLFFPKAAKRIIFSFFDVAHDDPHAIVLPPLLRPSLQGKIRKPEAGKYVVYLSAQDGFKQSAEDIENICKNRPQNFVLYAKGAKEHVQNNAHIKPHGHADFDKDLLSCEGLICTAGHSLLSEAVALGVPVLAMPMDIYEQQMNAHQIAQNGWGLMAGELNNKALEEFVSLAKGYQAPVRKQTHVADMLAVLD